MKRFALLMIAPGARLAVLLTPNVNTQKAGPGHGITMAILVSVYRDQTGGTQGRLGLAGSGLYS